MKRLIIAVTMGLALLAVADAASVLRPLVKRPAPPASNGKVLLADASSFILQTDAASKICIAGGC